MHRRWTNLLAIVALVLGIVPLGVSAMPAVSAGVNAPLALDPDDAGDGSKQITAVETAADIGAFVASASDGVIGEIAGATDPARYIVRLHDASLATYGGGLPGLAATTPRVTGAARLDVNAPPSQAYLRYLEARQKEVLTAVEITVGRSVTPVFQYLNVLNAFAVELTPDEAAKVAALPEVRAVYRDQERELDTDVGPALIGAPAFWDGDFGYNEHRGEGIIIGFLDTGVNYEHPSFAATDGDGYTHSNPYGSGNYVGVCNPGETSQVYDDICNDKLIGAWSLVSGPNSGASARDWNDHGSHVGGTIAGNRHLATFTVGGDVYTRTVSGVAPRANVISYQVCDPTCPDTSSVAAVNQAIADGVHVLNYSISGGDFPWNDAVDLAFLDAYAAGIFVSASAGNDGPGASTVAKTGPWNAAVAASTHNRVIANTVDVTAPTTPAELQGLAAVPGTGPSIVADIEDGLTWAGTVDPDNSRGCNPFPANAFAGAVALIQRGDCTFAIKVTNARNAGAVAVIVYNHVGGPPTTMGALEATHIPAVMVDNGDGDALAAYADAHSDAQVRINAATSLVIKDDWQDIVAGFSSRGPSQWDLLKPDYTAPGVNILAAGHAGADDYVFLQGTSMSSPHAAGAAALMVQRFPGWTPAEIKSALAMTAWQDMLKEDGLTPADFFDMGSGRLDLAQATLVGLVMDETVANYEAADPTLGGRPRDLNQPSMVDWLCAGSCSWIRTVRSVLSDTVTYHATTSAPAGMSVTVEPASFTLAPGATQALTITVDADLDALTVGAWAFAQVYLQDSAGVMTLLEEDFADATFPPSGWAVHKLQGEGDATWIRDTAQFHSAPASARRIWSSSSDGLQDDWLVTPEFSVVENTSLSFRDRGQWMSDYGYGGVWLSTGSCDPADGEFVELREVSDTLDSAWRQVPPLDLSVYAGETACLAFRYSGTFAHTWWIDDVVVAVSSAPVHRLPIAVRPVEAAPVLTLDPQTLTSTQPPDTVTQDTLVIGNPGGLPLDWEFVTAGSGTIWDQPRVGNSGRINSYSNADSTGIYQTSAFHLFADVAIETIFIEGFALGTSLVNATALNWYIYPDADGSPVGNPEDNQDLHVWSYAAGIADPGVSIADDNMLLDLLAAGEDPVSLSAGTYWLLAYPDLPAVTFNPNVLYAWFHSGTGLGKQIGPGGLLGLPTSWSEVPEGRAFYLQGQITCTVPSWLTLDPLAGQVAPESAQNIAVTYDSIGMEPGSYSSVLCLASNDPDNELVVVSVTLNVQAASTITIHPEALTTTLPTGGQTDLTLTISNTGIADLVWEIEEEDTGGGVLAVEVLYDQTGNTTTSGALAIYDLDEPETWAVQAADDFVVPFGQVWTVHTVFAGGFYQGYLNPPQGVNVFIYADDGGLPGEELYAYPGLTPSADAAGDLTLDLPTPAVLEAGRYWVSVQPRMDFFEDGRWFWFMESVQANSEFAWRNPGNGYGTGCADWAPGSSCGFGQPDLTFQIIGARSAPCLDLADLPWLSVAPRSGTTAAGDSDEVVVTFDATSLAVGEYTGNLCIFSNDPETPFVVVPVTMDVGLRQIYLPLVMRNTP